MTPQNSMPPVTPYLTVKGASDAIEFYKKAFGATENARLPYEDGKRLMHAEISLHGSVVLLSDEFLEHDMVRAPANESASPVAVALHFNEAGRPRQGVRARQGCRREEHGGAGRHVLGRPLRGAVRSLQSPLADARAAAAEVRRTNRTRTDNHDHVHSHRSRRSTCPPSRRRRCGVDVRSRAC